MNELKLWLEKKYGKGADVTINYDGEKITGTMYGNDECFDINEFYQFFLTDDTLYKAYYEIPEGEEDLGRLDYDNPIDLKDVDAQYYIDYVI